MPAFLTAFEAQSFSSKARRSDFHSPVLQASMRAICVCANITSASSSLSISSLWGNTWRLIMPDWTYATDMELDTKTKCILYPPVAKAFKLFEKQNWVTRRNATAYSLHISPTPNVFSLSMVISSCLLTDLVSLPSSEYCSPQDYEGSQKKKEDFSVLVLIER